MNTILLVFLTIFMVVGVLAMTWYVWTRVLNTPKRRMPILTNHHDEYSRQLPPAYGPMDPDEIYEDGGYEDFPTNRYLL